MKGVRWWGAMALLLAVNAVVRWCKASRGDAAKQALRKRHIGIS
ncbi:MULTISPECIES: hypothetical protein [Brasilonema]|nr:MULTISPECIES: hypothetical protein [Brasilonema]